MATLVLSTVGTVLGGPVGSAIGALIGQAIDQELLAPASRGPRLGDLGLQTSNYGTQVPQIYGTMRVAGSIVWATDLVEGAATTGAKGQPNSTFSYSVSFAVALSSRPISAIKRVWADGKLIRGEDGLFKIGTTFRFYPGGENQPIDPLIGSIEGLADTPAYRGLALAVFENLELVEFGNRLPFLTFEVVADEQSPDVGSILAEVSAGIVQVGADALLSGYAAYGRSMKAAIEPLVEPFALKLFDDGAHLRSPTRDEPIPIGEADFGSSADGEQPRLLQREQAPLRSLPGSLSISSYDPTRDFQTGEARAVASEQPGSEERQQLPMVLEPDVAKSLAQQMLARRWAERDVITVRLPMRHLSLEPGEQLDLPLAPRMWTVQRTTIEGFVTVAELRPSWSPAIHLPADSGRIAQQPDEPAAEMSVALFELPQVWDQSSDNLTVLVAASAPTRLPRSRGIEISAAAQTFVIPAPVRNTVLGRALSVLPSGEPYLIDTEARVQVELVDPSQWLLSCDDDALVAGSNLAVLGSELFQFASVAPLGDGRFELSRLLRGRLGTEWAAADHMVGEPFALLHKDQLRPVPLALWSKGSQISATVENIDGTAGQSASLVSTGESLRPIAPTHLHAELTASGELIISWTRRSRRGWAWLDEIDAPLGEAREAYWIMITGSGGALELGSTEPRVAVDVAELAKLGSGPAAVDVRQIGDWAASHPARCAVFLN